MKRLIGYILIIGALALGYLGYNKLQENKAEIKIGDLEISANAGDTKQEAYLMFGLGVVCLLAGMALSRGKN